MILKHMFTTSGQSILTLISDIFPPPFQSDQLRTSGLTLFVAVEQVEIQITSLKQEKIRTQTNCNINNCGLFSFSTLFEGTTLGSNMWTQAISLFRRDRIFGDSLRTSSSRRSF